MALRRGSSKQTIKQIQPIFSGDREEARHRVIGLYKAWYRQIPFIIHDYNLSKDVHQCRNKLREQFLKNKDIADIRVTDMLVIKGQLELKGTINIWKQNIQLMSYWTDAEQPEPTEFLSKFLSGQN